MADILCQSRKPLVCTSNVQSMKQFNLQTDLHFPNLVGKEENIGCSSLAHIPNTLLYSLLYVSFLFAPLLLYLW